MADQPDYTGSCMIALYPPPGLAEALAICGKFVKIRYPEGLDSCSTCD